jgi:hypothetical protein
MISGTVGLGTARSSPLRELTCSVQNIALKLILVKTHKRSIRAKRLLVVVVVRQNSVRL